MALNSGAKDWLAANAGSNDCFAPSGINYKDGDGVSHTGSTGDVAAAFYVAHQAGTDTAVIIAGTNYNQFKVINGLDDINMTDVGWVYANDGSPQGEAKYCKTAATPTPTPTPAPPGIAVALIGTLPGGAAYWLDTDPSQVAATGITKDMMNIADIIKTNIAVPAKHCISYRLAGYENVDACQDVPEGVTQWGLPLDVGYLKAKAGTDSAMLTVQAFKEEAKTVEILNGIVRLGAVFFGFTPTAKSVPAPVSPGKKYTVSISADGREDASTEVTMVKNTPQTVKVYMKQSGKITIKISPAIAFIGDLSGGPYQVWYIGAKQTGYVRVDTGIIGKFRAVLKFDLPNVPPIYTQAKVLTPNMEAKDRRLDWPYLNDGKYQTPTDWIVPDKSGVYIITGELFVEVII